MPKRVVIRENWGGITDDSRSETRVSFDVLKHWDLSKSVKGLVPHRALEADDSSTKKVTKFEYANSKFYGFGVDTTNGNKLTVYVKDPFDSGSWSAATGGESTATGGAALGIPKHYKNYIYGVWNTNRVFQYGDITGVPTFTDSFQTLSSSPTVAAEPIIAKDDNLYIPYDNKLMCVDGSTPTDPVLTLPDNLRIRSLENWGDYLAIGCSGNTVGVESKVFLWNLIDADPTTVINFGKEVLYQIANLDGSLIGISLTLNSSINFTQKLVVKEWVGGDNATTKLTKDLGAQGYTVLAPKFVENNQMYFCVDINSNSSTHNQGIWTVGRKNSQYPWRLNQEIKSINDDVETNTQGFFKLGDYFWIAHSNDGSIERTNDSAVYTTTSIAETEIFAGEGDEIAFKKKLTRVGVVHQEYAGGESIVLKYKKDVDSAYTTLLTSDTSGATAKYVTRTSADASLPSEWHEIQFRLESTGGGKPLAIVFEYELMERR